MNSSERQFPSHWRYRNSHGKWCFDFPLTLIFCNKLHATNSKICAFEMKPSFNRHSCFRSHPTVFVYSLALTFFPLAFIDKSVLTFWSALKRVTLSLSQKQNVIRMKNSICSEFISVTKRKHHLQHIKHSKMFFAQCGNFKLSNFHCLKYLQIYRCI